MRTQHAENTHRSYTFTEWLETYQNSSTRAAYHSGVGSFLRSVYQTDAQVRELADRYIKETRRGKRDFGRDLLDYINSTQKGQTYAQKARLGKAMPPMSLHLCLAATKNFLSYCCDIEIPNKDWRIIRNHGPKGTRARTQEADFTSDVIRRILLHCDIRLKALILVLIASGVRVGEALQLKLDDIDLEASPAVVHVRGEYAKEGDAYTSFIGGEAKGALLEWLKVRENFMAFAASRAHNSSKRKANPWRRELVPPSENSVFPFTYTSARLAFERALKAADLYVKDKSTGISTIRVHMCRKYFLSQAKTKMPSEVAEAMVGHASYLSDAYRRYNTQQLAEFYRKAEPALLIFQDSRPLEQLDERNRQFDEIVRHNQSLSAELANIKADQSKLQDFVMNALSQITGVNLTEPIAIDAKKMEFTVGNPATVAPAIQLKGEKKRVSE